MTRDKPEQRRFLSQVFTSPVSSARRTGFYPLTLYAMFRPIVYREWPREHLELHAFYILAYVSMATRSLGGSREESSFAVTGLKATHERAHLFFNEWVFHQSYVCMFLLSTVCISIITVMAIVKPLFIFVIDKNAEQFFYILWWKCELNKVLSNGC